MGKSTGVSVFKIIGYLSIGIGDKAKRLYNHCEFIFDERITKKNILQFELRKKGVCKKRSTYSNSRCIGSFAALTHVIG